MRQWAKRNDKKKFTIDLTCDPFGIPGKNDGDPYTEEGCKEGEEGLLEFIKQQPDDAYQYSFVGPLSMQKGCDNAFHMYTKKIGGTNNGIGYESNKLSYRGMADFLFSGMSYKIYVSGENPLVVTDARCFMPWIASQYNMKLEKEYEERANCKKGEGQSSNIDKKRC